VIPIIGAFNFREFTLLAKFRNKRLANINGFSLIEKGSVMFLARQREGSRGPTGHVPAASAAEHLAIGNYQAPFQTLTLVYA
jgi:hypothetical protein